MGDRGLLPAYVEPVPPERVGWGETVGVGVFLVLYLAFVLAI